LLVASSTVIKGWEQWPPAAFILLANSWILIQPFSIKKINNSTAIVTTTRKTKNISNYNNNNNNNGKNLGFNSTISIKKTKYGTTNK
jgi:hypothetical protein